METVKYTLYVVYRKFYGYLFQDRDSQIGYSFKRMEEGIGSCLPLVYFRSKSEASNWRRLIPDYARLWFGDCETSIRKFEVEGDVS